MQLTYLGHAGIRVDAPDIALAVDPWLSPQGAFQASWFQFPSNHHLDLATVLDCNVIAISHEHLDHLDPWLLSQLHPGTQVLIPTYPSPRLRRRLAAAGVRDVTEIAPWHKVVLNDDGDWMVFIPEECPKLHDSAVLVHAGGSTLLHCNDARLSVAQARRAALLAGGSIDVMTVQMSGANWHPICYEYDTDTIWRMSAARRLSKFKSAARLVGPTQPRLVVPMAGPPCFLDGQLREHNQWIPAPGRFPDMDQCADWLTSHLPKQSVASWLPGDVHHVASGQTDRHPQWEDFSFSSLTPDYFDNYAADRQHDIDAVYAAHPEPRHSLADLFTEHFEHLATLSPFMLKHVDMTMRFDIDGRDGERFDLVFQHGRLTVDTHARARDVQYRLTLSSRWLLPVLEGRASWEDLLLSLRFSAWRSPDVFNDYLFLLLKHADYNSLKAIEDYELRLASDTEKIVVDTSAGRYEIDRFCPHRGQDLSEGAVINGNVLQCLAHGLQFDIASGQCLTATCRPLASRRLGSPPQLLDRPSPDHGRTADVHTT